MGRPGLTAHGQAVLALIDELKERELFASSITSGDVTVKLGGLLRHDNPEDDREPDEQELRAMADEAFSKSYGASAGGIPGLPE